MELLQRRMGVELADALGRLGVGHHGIAAQAVAQQGAAVHQVESEGQEGKACEEGTQLGRRPGREAFSLTKPKKALELNPLSPSSLP